MTGVVAQHCGLAPFGWSGVWLFYVISGFVIARNFYSSSYVSEGPSAYLAFMKRRFVRIVPVYAFYILVCTTILVAGGQSLALRDLPFLASFTFNWQMIFSLWPNPNSPSFFGHLWTLSVEEQFYILFPLLFIGLSRPKFVRAILVLAALGPVVRLAYSILLSVHSSDAEWKAFAIYASSFAHFDAFLLGAVVAHFEPQIKKTPSIFRMVLATAMAMSLAYTVTYVMINRAQGATGIDQFRDIYSGVLFGQGREVFVYLSVNLIAVAAVMAAALQKPLLRAVSRAPVVFIGAISYSAYVYHALVLWVIAETVQHPAAFTLAPRILWFAIAWLATVCLAALSYRYLEQPILRRWSPSPKAPRGRIPVLASCS